MRQEKPKVQSEDFNKPADNSEKNGAATARVQKHRAKLKAGHCGRVEAWVPNTLIQALHTVAREQDQSLRVVIREALMAYVTRHAVMNRSPRYIAWPT